MTRAKLLLCLTCAAVLSACSNSADTSAFDVSGYVVGTTDNQNDFARSACTFYDGTITAGTPVVLRGADGTILSTGMLSENTSSSGPACSFTFRLESVKAGESGYEIDVAPYKPLVVTEEQLRHQPQFGLGVRNATDILMGKNRQPISVSTD